MNRMIVVGMVFILGMNLSTIAQDTTTHASTGIFDVQLTDQKGIFKVNYLGIIPGNVIVKVYDQDGTELIQKIYSRTRQFTQLYNFGTAPKGRYTFVATTPVGKDVEEIYFSGISLPELEVSSTEEPSKIRLTMKNADGRPLTLILQDAASNRIHTQTVEVAGKVEQVYDLAQLPGKEVTFVVVNELGQSRKKTYQFE